MPQEIVDEAEKIFLAAPRSNGQAGSMQPLTRFAQHYSPDVKRTQIHIDSEMLFSVFETMGIAEFSERYLTPMMIELARSVPHDVKFLELEMPPNTCGARGEILRFLHDSFFSATEFDEDGEPTAFGTIFVGRFDVLFEPKVVAEVDLRAGVGFA